MNDPKRETEDPDFLDYLLNEDMEIFETVCKIEGMGPENLARLVELFDEFFPEDIEHAGPVKDGS